jgi:hypothetical protein
VPLRWSDTTSSTPAPIPFIGFARGVLVAALRQEQRVADLVLNGRRERPQSPQRIAEPDNGSQDHSGSEIIMPYLACDPNSVSRAASTKWRVVCPCIGRRRREVRSAGYRVFVRERRRCSVKWDARHATRARADARSRRRSRTSATVPRKHTHSGVSSISPGDQYGLIAPARSAESMI